LRDAWIEARGQTPQLEDVRALAEVYVSGVPEAQVMTVEEQP